MALITDQLSAPASSMRKKGRYVLNRIFKSEATVTKNVTPTNMTGIEAIEWGEPTWDEEVDILQQGAGDTKTHVKHGPKWSGSITVLSGSLPNVIAKIQGITWGSGSGEYAAVLTRQSNDYPQVHWEAICRDDDNKDHLFSAIVQDMILDDSGFSNPLEYEDGTIPFHTYSEPFYLKADHQLIYDIYDASGVGATLTDYALTATPVVLASPAISDGWDFNNLIFVKEKASGASTGTRKRQDVSVTNATVSITPGTPASGGDIQVLYAHAV